MSGTHLSRGRRYNPHAAPAAEVSRRPFLVRLLYKKKREEPSRWFLLGWVGAMAHRSLSRVMSFGISDLALEFVLGYMDDPRDREAVSLVCKKWYQIDALSRKHVTIAISYSTSPDRLRRRFPNLESLKLKGKPRAAMFNLIPEDWGGYAGPWVREIAEAFNCLKSLHLRRMIVKDEDITVLVKARGHMLESLKLDKCSGFSTDALLLVARSCRYSFLVD
ncbi:hypothetical protein BHE74_00036001 [Ensete ventricosum]|nr:hypothetical protein BHE74_00036001 [Ensete ventricosum]